MGVVTGVSSMSTTTDVIYTHKKFKRAAAEAWEGREVKENEEGTKIQRLADREDLTWVAGNQPSNEPSPVLGAISGYLSINGHPLIAENSADKIPYGDGNKWTCDQCGFISYKYTVFDQHACTKPKNDFYCSKCRQNFNVYIKYQNHDCLISNISRSGKRSFDVSQRTQEPILYSEQKENPNSTEKVVFSRSHSFPYDLNLHKQGVECSSDRSEDLASQNVSGAKQIYKPKFRAQYSLQEEPIQAAPSSPLTCNSMLSKPIKSFQDTSSYSAPTYHMHTPLLLNSGSSFISEAGAISPRSVNQGRYNISSLESKSTKVEELPSLPKGVNAHCSNLWKGIKSPSPELVGQHINNLIVQNQAIVETHNPLWSMKYRRQCSAGSSQAEGDGSTGSKSRRGSVNEYSRQKSQSNIGLIPNSSRESSLESRTDSPSSLVPSLPKSFHGYSHSASLIRASKPNISNLLTTSVLTSHGKSVEGYSKSTSQFGPMHIDNKSSCINSKIPFSIQGGSSVEEYESLDLTKANKAKNMSHPSLSCFKCGLFFHSNNSRENHLKYYCQFRSNQFTNEISPIEYTKSSESGEQEVALDLHKRREKTSQEYERSSSRSSSISEPGYKRVYEEENKIVRGLSISPSIHRHDSFLPSPPLKRRKVSVCDNVKTIPEKSLYSIFPRNGKVASNCDYGSKMLDDLGKPKGNSHHIYGGEVQICDGKELKTLKIDSIKSETPSLDSCIVSKHLGVDNESKDDKLPTSVVVTIAKSGLNSGGTMVKVENQSNYTSRKLGLTVTTASNLSNSPNSYKSEHMANLHSQSPGGISSPCLNIHPSLLQYSPQVQMPSLEIQGVSVPNMAGLSFQFLKGSIPTASLLPSGLTLHSSHPNATSLYNPIVTQSLTTNVIDSSLKYKEDSLSSQKILPSTFPTIISIGDEIIPYVPGIPGPYSQAGIIVKHQSKHIEPLHSSISVSEPLSKQLRQPNSPFYHQTNISSTPTSVLTYTSSLIHSTPALQNIERINSISKAKYTTSCTRSENYPSDGPVLSLKPQAKLPKEFVCGTRTPEIRVQPPPIEIVDLKNRRDEDNEESSMVKNEDDGKPESSDDGNTFLVPRKRPNTLIIKPQSFSLKSSLTLIGSTLVSPDTPRPKKSCAQLFLNGSAYTYLNLKVSTKTFFCCIYRPQPMYVLQSTNPKLSMYSNWQVRKTENPLNISPVEAMSLHVSGHYFNRAYTIAKPKTVQLHVTPSSYWTQREARNNQKAINCADKVPNLKKEIDDESMLVNISDSKCMKEKHENSSNMKEKESDDVDVVEGSSPKRIKIFEGGFKTNEDYTYVRGRGRGRYVCETCGIRCKKPSMLKKHIRTHTDLRPFACKHCSFSFKTKGNLTKHLKSKAHFKRCTEMGIVPVPVSVDESHINKEALQLQGILEHGKENSQSMEEGEDDDDDEDEEDEEEEIDGEEEEEEDDDEEEESETKFKEVEGSPPHNFEISDSFLSTDEEQSVPISHPKEEILNLACENLSNSNSCKNNDDSVPMDLSIKRPSVISTLIHKEPLKKEGHNRPTYLPLSQKPFDSKVQYPLTTTPCQTGSTPIKEHRADILSPVTESSMLLKSIYNTTFQTSSSNLEKRSFASDPIKEDGSCGFMLQTYLTERAVLDSARKRHQYLQPTTDQPHIAQHSQVQTLISCSTSLTLSPRNEVLNDTPVSDVYACTLSDSGLPTTFVSHAGSTKNILRGITSQSLAADLKGKTEINKSLSVNSPLAQENASTSVLTSESPVLLASAGSGMPNNGTRNSAKIIVNVSTVASTSTSSVIKTSKISANPYGASNVRINPSLSKSIKGSVAGSGGSLATFTGNSQLLTPPANLTVINSCSGDSKTAFIAPSGVIPSSNNRMGSDDGKCKCSLCHKEFAKQAQLRLHMNIHYIERPHRCDSCGVSFRTNGHLQKHKRSVSHFNKVNMNMTFGTPSMDNPRPFKCHDCKIAFRIHGHLAKHLRSKLHIMKLECLGKLPFGTYAEIERSGVNLNEIDTSDCENSLESLQVMASKLYEKEPAKLLAWQNQQQQQQKQSQLGQTRVRSVSNSSTNSEEYPLLDDQESGTPSSSSTSKSNEEESDDEDPADATNVKVSLQTDQPVSNCSSSSSSSSSEQPTSPSSSLPPYEVGSGATEGLLGCPQCHEKFLDFKLFEMHYCTEHENTSKSGRSSSEPITEDTFKVSPEVSAHCQQSNSSSTPASNASLTNL